MCLTLSNFRYSSEILYSSHSGNKFLPFDLAVSVSLRRSAIERLRRLDNRHVPKTLAEFRSAFSPDVSE